MSAQVQALLHQCMHLFQQKKFEEALGLCRQILKTDKSNPHALNAAGLIYRNLGDDRKALGAFEKALKRASKDPVIRLNYAQCLEKLQKLPQARKAYQQVLNFDPQNFAALNNLGQVCLSLDHLDEAQTHLEHAQKINPASPVTLSNLGLLRETQGKLDEAISCFDKALELSPNTPLIWLYGAQVLSQLSRLEDTLAYCDKAIALAPGFAQAHRKRGRTLMECGRLAEAEKALNQALSLDKDVDTYAHLASLNVIKSDDPRLEEMKALFADTKTAAHDREILGYAIAKVLDAHQNYDEAFSSVKAANQIRRKGYSYSVQKSIASLRARLDLHREKTLPPITKQRDLRPIFVLGMPRSGTTLVEQIIASHPDVTGGGELSCLGDALSRTCEDYLQNKRLPTPDELEAIAEYYLDQLEKRAEGRKIITDKLPGNFEFIGLIMAALPHASIIHVRRDPVDTCLSNYMQRFGGFIPYANDLSELGQYYCAYDDMMKEWEKLYPGKIYHITYEDLIADQRHCTSSLLEHCVLTFEEACLNFHKQDRFVNTASYIQVRQPIYNKSVSRWHHYQDHLGPLLKELGIT